MKSLRFLVLDEADRMIEAGHFAELENILRLTLRENKSALSSHHKSNFVDFEVQGRSNSN